MDPATAVQAAHYADQDDGRTELEQDLDPVDARGVGHPDPPRDTGADERGDDTDDDGQPDGDVLLARQYQPGQRTDDQADHDRADDRLDGHGTRSWSAECER